MHLNAAYRDQGKKGERRTRDLVYVCVMLFCAFSLLLTPSESDTQEVCDCQPALAKAQEEREEGNNTRVMA